MRIPVLTSGVICITLLLSGCAGSGKTITRTAPGNAAADSSAQRAATVKVSASPKSGADTKKLPAGLTPAARIMIRACDNYCEIDSTSPKIPEVLILKAAVYYNNKLYAESREVYQQIISRFPAAGEGFEAVRMTAQSYYEEGNFDQAQTWYRKLKDLAVSDGNRDEAVSRIAESIFRMAEMYEKQQKPMEAAAQYERVALEFPEAVIADISLYNAGLSYEKTAEWARAILVFQRLKTRYQDSKLVPKSMFRMAKCYEKLTQWDDAAQTYLRIVASYPASELSQSSLYNAGFCFENADKPVEAAATFEKHAMSFPQAPDAADILFKAGELYGKLKDWASVTRVNKEFSRRYGNDKDRIVQAQCMVGIALYMQNNLNEAIQQLNRAASTYAALNNPSTVNKYYAANSQFTVGEIYQDFLNKIELKQPKEAYKRDLKAKTDYLERAVDAYSNVIRYGISEWTTRAVYQIGQAYEDLAYGIFRQERPKNIDFEKGLALEMGIAKAVEEYFINSALPSHLQNVKLGIKEKIENKHILNSKKKLVSLPCAAGQNYCALVNIMQNVDQTKKLEDFALIAHKLQVLQKIAPFQERAIDLFLKTLELGSMYQETGDDYKTASSLITRISFDVAKTYGEIVEIARGAPIPGNFDAYESYVYKTKLLKQIEGYEESALANYLKTVKIAKAYAILDTFVVKTREALAKQMFERARCYDVLCVSAFESPPYPAGIDDAEKDEYRARFEEIGLAYQEKAFEIYRTILSYAQEGFTAGDYVNHAYVRLYQNFPKEFGFKIDTVEIKTIEAGPKWKCSADSIPSWQKLEFNDDGWQAVKKETLPQQLALKGFPEKDPVGMWQTAADQTAKADHLLFRRTFYLNEPPHDAMIYVAAADTFSAYINGDPLVRPDSVHAAWTTTRGWNLKGKIRQGKNVIAIDVTNRFKKAYGLYASVTLTVTANQFLPKFPFTDDPVDKEIVSEEQWVFPRISNFTLE
jgi:tetratricopeptide (TPR) repeat protein